MPKVKLELESRPESLILVRGMLAAVAELLDFDAELLHNLKTVVSEACNNVVLHAYDGEAGRLAVDLEIGPDEVEAVVRDWGCGICQITPSEDRINVGLAVISALADRAQFVRVPEGGTEVRMAFTDRSGIRSLERRSGTRTDEQVAVELAGDAIATLSPGLLAGVLARVATALAARARFSLDRFCDVYLVADAVAAHAEPAAIDERLSFAITARDRRLELTVGPFRAGSGAAFRSEEGLGRLGSALTLLSVELAVEPVSEAEVWRLVVLDGNGASLATAALR
ncbi:MAG TPA: ATP-binding protein [Solirubrobacteraceae bacterium]